MTACKLAVQNRDLRADVKAFFTAYLGLIRDVIENPPEKNSYRINFDKKRKMTLQFSLDSDGQKWYTLDYDYESEKPIETGTYVGDSYLDFEDCAEKLIFDLFKIVDSRISFLQ